MSDRWSGWVVAAAAGYVAYRLHQHTSSPRLEPAVSTPPPPPPPPTTSSPTLPRAVPSPRSATTPACPPPARDAAAAAAAAAEAEARLLPPPASVRAFLASSSSPTGPDGELRHADATAAAEWMTQVAAAAHASPRVKAAGRELLAAESFAANLARYRVPDSVSNRLIKKGTVWTLVVQPQLEGYMANLAAKMAAANAELGLAAELGTSAVVAACTRRMRNEGGACPASWPAPRQDTAMPQLAACFDWADWAARPEHVYAHVLMLLAAAVRPQFAMKMAALAEAHPQMPAVANGSEEGTGVGTADDAPSLKPLGQMLRNVVSADAHRYEPKPRPACNADIIRQTVSTATTLNAKALLSAFSRQFGGLTGLQCFPDPAAGSASTGTTGAGSSPAPSRYNAYPIVANVLHAPGCTVDQLLASASVQETFAELRDNMPRASGLHKEQWEADHDAALLVLRRPVEINL